MKDELKPFFSIIIPVYNGEKYIKNCLDSIITQLYLNYEVILVDDGSLDRSGKICDEYVERYPDYFFVQHTVNQGVSSARNMGLSMAGGEFIVFIDCDDIVTSSYLEEFFRMITLHEDVDIAVCGVKVNNKNIVLNGKQNKNGYINKQQFYTELIERNSIKGFLWNKVFRRSVIVENNIILDKNSHMCEDLLFCLEITSFIRNVYFVNTPNYYYIQRVESAVHRKFNPKLISVLYTYGCIIDILKIHANTDTIKKAYGNLLIHNINLYLMFNREEGYEEVIKSTRTFIKKNIRYIFQSGIGNKLRFKAIITYMWVYF